MKPKIMVVIGTRPEAIKMAPVLKELKKHKDWFEVMLVSTGQHKEQIAQVFDCFGIKPDVDFHIMKAGQSLLYIMTEVMTQLERLIKEKRPDFILVHGDTQTTVAAGLAAFYSKVPFGHVEAGLRSYDRMNPWPEEMNRMLVDQAADLLFAPTKGNKENLLKQGIDAKCIFVTGQTAIDAAALMQEKSIGGRSPVFCNLDEGGTTIVMTVHRRESWEGKLEHIFLAAKQIVEENPNVQIVFPMHKNPLIRKAAVGILRECRRIYMTEPLAYPDMICMLSKAALVMSDSGGIQEECLYFHKPLILLRDTTERPEGIEANGVILAGTEQKAIAETAKVLLSEPEQYKRMQQAVNPFGDGKAAERIVLQLARYFCLFMEPIEEFLI
ncbi:MAG: UDP-N-acetylglucosamine 2-epimerase (non-hydrolyzing) [Lachnospiraceae bacterium]|nr:UDP-N-acetylglucosamine 2-epimerase (non-hydrolyzing) [Lachnospiraceae bacterium]